MNKLINKILLFVMIFILGFTLLVPNALAYVRVKGYYRSNGTYVQPHYRSNPDSYRWNNWSSQGNYNPYTGLRGYRSLWSW